MIGKECCVKALQETGKLARFGWFVGSAEVPKMKSCWAVWQNGHQYIRQFLLQK
jgi:hypothetical protein